MGRAPCCDKTKVKRGPWSPEEDNTLKEYIHQFGNGGNWIALPQKAGLKRCGKSCRLRWLNYLRPDIKHGGFTEEEDNIILTLYHNIGSRWSVIASHLKGRTDNDVKNYWNTKLKKKLLVGPKPGPNTNKETTNHTMHYWSSTTPSPPFVLKVDNYNYNGNVSDFPNVNYQQTLAPQEPISDPVQASLPTLMEVGTSAISTMSQEVSNLSPPVKNRCGLWCGDGGGHEDDGLFFMGLVGRSSSFSPSYDVLNDFGV